MKYKFLLLGLGLIIGGIFFVFQNLSFNDSKLEVATPEELQLNAEQEVAYWVDRIKKIGGKETYEEFGKLYSKEDNIGTQHQKAHLFGEALYKGLGVDGVAVCDSNFGFGCYHSFFGFAILDKGVAVLPELDQACIEVYGKKGLGCQHGIGHGVIVEMGYDELASALTECSKLDWQGPIGGCTSGVLMEYNHHTMEDSGVREPVAGDYHYPCNSVENRFVEACYFEQPAWWSVLTGTDYVFIGKECEKAPPGLAREACYRGVGNLAAGVLSFSLPEITKSCQMMPNIDGEILCVEGAAWIVSYEPSKKDTWTELCEPYEGEYHRRCLASHDFI